MAETREVALLLTDVESSTRLLVRHGQTGVRALERVGEVVSAAASTHGGAVSRRQGEGDSALVVFASASAAVAAALEVNERLAAERWPDGEAVAVRSAVHVGEVTTLDEGVIGLEVHRCARVRALADGGEVYLSDAAVTSVGDRLPAASSVADQGVVLLRGFARPERVWRLVHPALPSPRRTIVGATPPGAVPMWRTSLVGRVDDVASVAARLAPGRVVSLVGPGGVGKTRLAAAVVQEAEVCFVDLTQAARDSDVVGVTAAALGAKDSSDPLGGIEVALAASPMIVVLDNCEHVLDGAAALAEHITERGPTATVLATSRTPLRIDGEEIVHIAPLSTGRDRPATRLFLDRAHAAGVDLVADDVNAEQIVAITRILDGVPLAIELAAARMSTFSTGELVALLQRDAAGLTDARRRGPDRHRALQATIQWSMNLLDHEERTSLCRLALLPGSFRLRSAQAVAGDDGSLVATLHSLVEQSLVATEHGVGATRYRLLEMVRSVAEQELSADERRDAMDRLLTDCIDELAALDGEVPPAPGFEEEIARDGALFAAAIDHAVATGQTDLGLRLVHDVFVVWHGTSQRLTIDRWMSALIAGTTAPSRLRAMVLRRQAIIAFETLGDHERTAGLLDAAESDALAVADRSLLGRIRGIRAGFDIDRGRLDGVEEGLQEAIELLEESGDEFLGDVFTWMAQARALRARYDEADELFQRAAASHPHWFQRIHIEIGRAWCALLAGRIDAAADGAATALEMAERTGDPDIVAHSVEIAAQAAMAGGHMGAADELFSRVVAFSRQHDLGTLAGALAGHAISSVIRGDLEAARNCGDELRDRPVPGNIETILYRQLASAFVDLALGDAAAAAAVATDTVTSADRLQLPYTVVLAKELLAASVGADDPAHARRLLAAASEERTAIGAAPWPLEPFRRAADQILRSTGGADAGR